MFGNRSHKALAAAVNLEAWSSKCGSNVDRETQVFHLELHLYFLPADVHTLHDSPHRRSSGPVENRTAYRAIRVPAAIYGPPDGWRLFFQEACSPRPEDTPACTTPVSPRADPPSLAERISPFAMPGGRHPPSDIL